MAIWLVYRKEDVPKNNWYIQQYISIGKQQGIEIELVLSEEIHIVCCQEGFLLYRDNQPVPFPKAAIIRTINPKLSELLEINGVRVFNPSIVSKICNDKALTYMKAAAIHIPMIPTENLKRDELAHYLTTVTKEQVVKTVDGHGGQEVFLIPSEQELPRQEKEHMVKVILSRTQSDFVAQPLIGSRHQDLRVYVLGSEILCAVLRTSQQGFKANYSLGGRVERYELNVEEEKLIQRIITEFPFDLVGIDFLIGDQGQLIFNEIEDVVGARMLYQCTDIPLVERYIQYIKKVII